MKIYAEAPPHTLYVTDVEFLDHFNATEAAYTEYKEWCVDNLQALPEYVSIQARDVGYLRIAMVFASDKDMVAFRMRWL